MIVLHIVHKNMADAQSIAIQYAPFNSRVHPGFWNTFTKLKLDVLGLTEKSVRVIDLTRGTSFSSAIRIK